MKAYAQLGRALSEAVVIAGGLDKRSNSATVWALTANGPYIITEGGTTRLLATFKGRTASNVAVVHIAKEQVTRASKDADESDEFEVIED